MSKRLLVAVLLAFGAPVFAAQSDDGASLKSFLDRGDDFLSDDRFDDAIGEFRHAIQAFPQSSEAHQRLAQAYSLSGLLDEALREENKAIALDPANAAAHSNKAWLLGMQKQYGEAAREAQAAIKLDPDESSSYLTLGLALASLGDYNGAIKANQKAVELDPDNMKAYINLGACLGRSHDYQSAVTVYRKALTIRPNSVAAYLGLGAALSEMGKIDDAIQEFKYATTLAPSSDNAHGKLGWALYRKGNLQGALSEGWTTNWLRLQKFGLPYLQNILTLWGAVFLLFGLIFATIFLGSKFKPQADETIARSYFLTFYKDKPGRFVITNKRLVFVPEAFSRWFGSKTIEIDRSKISTVGTEGQGRGRSLAIELEDGTNYKFLMPTLVLEPLLAELVKVEPRTTKEVALSRAIENARKSLEESKDADS